MVKIISSFNSSIPSVRKVKNWLQTDPHHIWHGRDRLVVFFILAGDEAATAFIPLEEVDFSEQDEGLRMILESTHHEEMEKRNFYQQVYFKLNAHLDALDDLNIQLTSTSKDEDLDYYNQIIDSIHEQHEKLMNFINDVLYGEKGRIWGPILVRSHLLKSLRKNSIYGACLQQGMPFLVVFCPFPYPIL